MEIDVFAWTRGASLVLVALLSFASGAAVTVAWNSYAASPPAPAVVDVPHGKPADFNWVALPEFGGREAIIYRSPDGRRVAAAFEESGQHEFTYPFDEFLIVTSGSAEVAVEGGRSIVLRKGDVAYFREGTRVKFSFSKDFADVTCLMSDREVRWR
jgi:uncharacterized cupin superfamily protein